MPEDQTTPASAPGVTIRRRGLIAPTQALAPSPTASLTALVQSGRDVAGIAEALGVSPDEARARLDAIGLLDVVEPPAPAPAPVAVAVPVAAEPAPVAAQPTLAGLLVPAEAQAAPVAAAPVPAPAPAEVEGEASRRARKPGRPAAPTPSSTGLGVGYLASVYGAADYEALGRLYARALEEGTTVESIVANARLLVELADRLRLR
jgi:hypothetical protein